MQDMILISINAIAVVITFLIMTCLLCDEQILLFSIEPVKSGHVIFRNIPMYGMISREFRPELHVHSREKSSAQRIHT